MNHSQGRDDDIPPHGEVHGTDGEYPLDFNDPHAGAGYDPQAFDEGVHDDPSVDPDLPRGRGDTVAGSTAETSADAAISRAPETYWTASRAPLESLLFTMPLVLFYEAGVLYLGRGMPRNGADVWLRTLLDRLGFGAYFLLPAATILGLLAWHHLQHDRWRFSGRVLVGMAVESLLLATLLIGLAGLQQSLWPESWAAPLRCEIPADRDFVVEAARRMVGFCGAGLYEEVLFRLLLLPTLAWLLGRLGFAPSLAWFVGVIASSLLFSAAHYVGPFGEPLELFSFTFRTIAGCFFGLLFLVRGFGITAGTHAAYDMLVGLA